MNINAYRNFYSLTQEPNISTTFSYNSRRPRDELQDGLGNPYDTHSSEAS